MWENENRASAAGLAGKRHQPSCPTGSGGGKEGALLWEENRTHHVIMPPTFPRHTILLRTSKIVYIIFLELANSTISFILSTEKTSFYYHLQIPHTSVYLLAHYPSKSAPPLVQSHFLVLKIANFSCDSFGGRVRLSGTVCAWHAEGPRFNSQHLHENK